MNLFDYPFLTIDIKISPLGVNFKELLIKLNITYFIRFWSETILLGISLDISNNRPKFLAFAVGKSILCIFFRKSLGLNSYKTIENFPDFH